MEAKLNKSRVVSSKCYQKKDWYRIWMNLQETAVAFECFVDNMKMSYDPETYEYKNAEGVEVRPFKFGSTDGTEKLHPIVPA